MSLTTHPPSVSVVMATYNGEKFLRKQLDSVLNQSYTISEIIAVDDCSTDNTLSILNEYAAKRDNFIVVRNEHNLGYIKNFEKGFSLATSGYIAPCDQDDIWLPNKIEVLMNNIGNHAIAYCNSAFIDSTDTLIGNTLGDTKTFTDFDSPLMYLVGASAPSHAMLLKKSVAMEAMPFPELFSHDNWLGFVATFNSSVKFVNQVLVHYRRHDSNVFSTIHKTKKPKETKSQRIANAQQRLRLLYEKCPDSLPEKEIIRKIVKSYQSYSLVNNFSRMYLFLKYRREILMYKRHNALRRFLYCLKVFFKKI